MVYNTQKRIAMSKYNSQKSSVVIKKGKQFNMKQKLNIAMLGQKRVPSREGGVEIVVEELAVRMARLGHRVTCINRGGHHVSGKQYDGGNIKEYRGVRLKTVPTIDKKGLAAMTSSFTGAIAAAFGRYDVVHFHAEGPCAMIWIPKLFGKRCIATIHGIDWQRAKWGGFAGKYIRWGEKMAAKHADEVIVLSSGVQKYFKDTYGRDTIYIPNGVSKPDIKEPELITERLRIEKDGYILYLGRLVPEKGIEYLIRAYKSVNTDKKLVIAGGSSDTDEYAKRLHILAEGDDRIVFTGFVQGRMLEELYSNAYIYCLPSDLEGMPLSLLEAMSYGNCCVVSDIPECVDVVEEHGVVFSRASVENLTDKLNMLCQNQDIVSKHKNTAAEFICNKYNWDDVVEKTLEIYVK